MGDKENEDHKSGDRYKKESTQQSYRQIREENEEAVS
jgi:hypothetical protein